MSEGSACCCGEGSCFFGWSTVEDDWSNCGHTLEEELLLRRPRPSWSTKGTAFWTDCDWCCERESGNYCEFEYGSYQAGTWDIVVRYEHFNYPNPEDLYTWYYEPADPSMNPPCVGQVNTDCYNDIHDVRCCEDIEQIPFECGGEHGYWEVTASVYETFKRRMSDMQRRLVIGENIPPNPGHSPQGTIDWNANDAFRWLDGLADADQEELYPHWGYHPQAGPMYLGNRPLIDCLTVVLYREKWYKRYANNLRPDENPDSTVTGLVASCATPGYFVFGCTGIPVYSFEIHEAITAAGLGISVEDVILIIKDDQPLPKEVTDALEQYGALDIGDYDRDDGRCIRKTLNPVSGQGKDAPPIYETPQTRYFYGRYGGWSHVCFDILDGPTDFANFPQIVRQVTNQCGVNVRDCMSGVPGPRGDEEVVCWHNSQCPGADPCAEWGLVEEGAVCPCRNCSFQLDNCGDCTANVVSMNCTGARFLYAQYGYYPQRTNYGVGVKQFYCDENEAFVYRCDHLGNILRDEDGDNLPMPGSPHHAAPIHATEACRRRWSDIFFACCGSIGGWFQESQNGEICIIGIPRAGDCPDVDIGPQTKTWFL